MDAYAKGLTLTGPHTRDDFFRLYKKCKDIRLRERYQALYLSFSYGWKEIADIIGVSYETILEWVHLYNAEGLEGLLPDRPPGRPSALTDKQLSEVKDAVRQSPRSLGLKFSNWTLGRLSGWIADRFGIRLCAERIRQVLHAIGFSYARPRYSYLLADRKERTAFLEEFSSLDGALMFEDECTVSQHPSLHGMWVLKGTKPKVPTFGNHVKRHVFAAVDSVTGKAVSLVSRRLTADAFIGFLTRLLATVTRPFTLVMDNAPCHRAGRVKEFLERHKGRLAVLWLPKYSPDLNPSEQVWKDMKLDVSHNHFFSTADRLAWGIRGYFRRLEPGKVRSLCSTDYLFG